MGWELRDIYIQAFSGKLTRFEIARIVGARALQLSMGAPPLVELGDKEVVDPVYVAVLELMKGALPMSVLRRIGDRDELIPVQRLITPSVKRYLSTIIESWDISSRV